MGAEKKRIEAIIQGNEEWQNWGPYLPERMWGTVRECFSAPENAWVYTTFDTARERHYLTGDDGIFGWCNKRGDLCFALSFWNGKDPYLKERFFGLDATQGNHGEDVKEYYYYLMAVPSYSYAKALYKYPSNAYPYEKLIIENRSRTCGDPEYELIETGIFRNSEFFDIVVEYAKESPNNIIIQVTAYNRGETSKTLHIIPQFWFRSSWYWWQLLGKRVKKPQIYLGGHNHIVMHDVQLGEYRVELGEGTGGEMPVCLFAEYEPENTRLSDTYGKERFRKDAISRKILYNDDEFISKENKGTKVAIWYSFEIPSNQKVSFHIRFSSLSEINSLHLGEECAQVIQMREKEAEEFYNEILPKGISDLEKRISIQAYSGLLWSKIKYQLSVKEWLYVAKTYFNLLEHKSFQKWSHLKAEDVLSVPDKWEYPWFASWDLPFHLITMAHIDPYYAMDQVKLFLSPKYQSPTGQIPASEWNFSSVTPPVMAWGVNKLVSKLRQHESIQVPEERLSLFLLDSFCALHSNWLWWLNLKDTQGNTVFNDGFIGLDNFSIIERFLDGNIIAEDTQGVFWTPFFIGNLLELGCKIFTQTATFEAIILRLFEQFIMACNLLNRNEKFKFWNEKDKYFYPYLRIENQEIQVEIRNFSGLVPLFGNVHIPTQILPQLKDRIEELIEDGEIDASQLKYFKKVENHIEVEYVSISCIDEYKRNALLEYALNESEFLSPYGLRSLSRYHREKPIYIHSSRRKYEIKYCPAELESRMFGGNTNWFGPIWFPLNFLFIDSMRKWDVSHPEPICLGLDTTEKTTFKEIANDIRRRLLSLFLPNLQNTIPYLGGMYSYIQSFVDWKKHFLFYEYFNGDTGEGIGASHQTGWTALIAEIIQDLDHSEGEVRSTF